MKRTSAAAAGLCWPGALEGTSPGAAPALVDCHTHFYDPNRAIGVPWPPPHSPLFRSVLPADWRAVARRHGVTKTVVVEASPWLEDNQWILDLATRERDIVGFIGNLDFADADFPKHLARFAANPLFRGLRARSKNTREERVRGARALAERGLTLDMNGAPGFVAEAVALSREVPDLRIVIDHLGASGPAAKLTPQWKEEIRRAGHTPHIFMKVSALVEQAGTPPGEAPQELSAYLPILDHLWEHFGEDRLIFGSNWPVSDRGASYEVLFRLVREFFEGKGATEKYFRANSIAAYRWVDRG